MQPFSWRPCAPVSCFKIPRPFASNCFSTPTSSSLWAPAPALPTVPHTCFGSLLPSALGGLDCPLLARCGASLLYAPCAMYYPCAHYNAFFGSLLQHFSFKQSLTCMRICAFANSYAFSCQDTHVPPTGGPTVDHSYELTPWGHWQILHQELGHHLVTAALIAGRAWVAAWQVGGLLVLFSARFFTSCAAYLAQGRQRCHSLGPAHCQPASSTLISSFCWGL